MPPKGKKGKKGKKMPVLIDGVDTSAMTRDQLEAFAVRLKAEMDREREERNYFQLERDKIRTFWEITRQQLDETRYELQQKDKDIEATQDLSDIDKKHVMQQMKHLQFENHNKLGEVRAEAMTQLKLAQEHHVLQETELQKDKRQLRRILRERMEVGEMQLRQMETHFNEKLLEQRLTFERERKDNEMLHEEKMMEQKSKLDLFYSTQMFEVEERKNQQIRNLQDHHDGAFNDMKNYYNDITLNNLALIGSMKEQLEQLRKQTERSDRIAADTALENKRLREPLEQANIQLNEYRRKLEFYDRDKQQLSRLKSRNTKLEKKVKGLTWEAETLILRNDSLVAQRETLKERFNDVIVELQQKTGLKNVLLERKIAALLREEEKRSIILHETIATCAPNLADKLTGLDERVGNIVDEKNKIIIDLRYEVAKSRKAHDDLLETYECKLKQFGVPSDNLGFTPLRDRDDKQLYICGPAGIVTKNK
ncbi:dynein regulatory complex subunit 4 isoform X1 [Drosophila guanche]|uniref:Dynein regulatory complex subunit 4 n=1 Tax=Drosophila guanche TaxID=7266 RepID=A0A3B0JI34_DROGU|nr:dynein regulatory complex subunit 4 isoform X1 [Drosophila guanche]SPP80373.1 blast:Growth arrest-specific protein 8 homolog [Drosophila guanche]